jgi:hypothetical protein
MDKQTRLGGYFACVMALAIAGCAANGGIAPSAGSPALAPAANALTFGPGWIQKGGILYRTPRYMPTKSEALHRVAVSSVVSYGAGTVIVSPKVYLVFWGYKKYGDPDNVKPLLQSYMESMGGSTHNAIYTQYYQILNGMTTYVRNPKKQYGGSWNDNDPVPASPSDLQVANEALKAVTHFGYDPNGSYVIATPHEHSTSGFGSSWCGYHSAAQTTAGKLVSYTNLPYMPDGGLNCGSSATLPPSDETSLDEGVTIVEGHEEGESVTDPNPPAGWNNAQYGEIGDLCVWQNIANEPFGTYSYTMQPMFSNATASCVQTY